MRTEALNAPTLEPQEFVATGEEGTSVWIGPAAIEGMIAAASAAGRMETGGILIGRYGPIGWVADVLEATPQPKGSLAGGAWFQRSNQGLVELLRQRWEEGLHYLGEWHYHPHASPAPSCSDLRAMQAIARDGSYRCPSPLLVIIGGSCAGWKLSVTLFRNGTTTALVKAAGALPAG
ncbi:hypothetical protein EGJ03_00730 [Stenotrophomonas maltophilia]|nr:hypothetical protein EGJ06_01290 [Stenotrophomonas maltophilia]RRU14735.1 hypothetical protein EGJ77_01290 [Stenotrophomonas maltophilia]RRU36668.1 hypothetical protein EGJ03_00730 [Stenotrophomonas maltophilia]RRU88353.1 hypothetical protein EGI98_02985 [Stenotrophomonas maltophilia]RRV01253.1 hypothetical protein EGI91_00910 [Stenotrophomonas maltophilia]